MLTIITAALVIPVAAPAIADGEAHVLFEGKVQMQRIERLSSIKCQNNNAMLRLDILTAAPLVSLNPATVEGTTSYPAILTVDGGFCEDTTETFLATRKAGGAWEIKDAALQGLGTLQPEVGKTTFAVSISAKNATFDSNSFTRIVGTGITQKQTPPLPPLPTPPTLPVG